MSKDDFQLINEIGRGAYGVVYTALDKVTNQTVAVKIISLEQSWLPLLQEINMVVGLAHPTIVNYYGFFFVEQTLWLIMEYCDGGSLSDIMRTLKRPLTEKEVAATSVGVLEGLKYIHSTNRIHRDIKAGNLLVTSEGQVKLCDFGVSAQLDDSLAKTGTRIGSPYWMAPEVISSAPTGHNTKADIWSFGITLLELINGNPPLSQLQPLIAMMKIPQQDPPQAPPECSEDFKDFIKKTLIKDPELRPTAEQLMEHRFVKNAKPYAAETVRTLVEDFIQNRPPPKPANLSENGNGEEEEEEEEEDSNEVGFNLTNEAMSTMLVQGTFVAEATGTFVPSNDGTFVPQGDGTMVVSDGSKKSSGLSGWKMNNFIDSPNPTPPQSKLQKKRPFRNFKTPDLKVMLQRLKSIAQDELAKGAVSQSVIRGNYEDCRVDIVKELKLRSDVGEPIPDDYEVLP
jgi:serine/threonine protein kinase